MRPFVMPAALVSANAFPRSSRAKLLRVLLWRDMNLMCLADLGATSEEAGLVQTIADALVRRICDGEDADHPAQ